MHNHNKRTPRKGPMGSGPRVPEKAKDFKSAIARLLKELKGFQVLVVLSLVLAGLGSILSIIAPDHLKDLTNEIQKGLIVNSENLETISEQVMANLNEEKLASVMPKILEIDLSENTTRTIMMSTEISEEEKENFQNVMQSIVITTEQNEIFTL